MCNILAYMFYLTCTAHIEWTQCAILCGVQMYVWECVCACVWQCVCTCAPWTCEWRAGDNLRFGALDFSAFLLFLKEGLSLVWNPPSKLAWPPRSPQRSTCCPQTLHGPCHHACLFFSSGNWLRASSLEKEHATGWAAIPATSALLYRCLKSPWLVRVIDILITFQSLLSSC